MVSRVLVPMDDSETAGRALRYALEVHSDAEITVYHVVGAPSMMMGSAVGLALEEDLEATAEERAKPIFDRARDIAAEYNTEIETDIGLGHPTRAIVNRAENYDTIVMGTHGEHSEGITRSFLVGNIAKTVFERSPIPVTTVR
jgi:nucleotide-binding universal stress UspA family protein